MNDRYFLDTNILVYSFDGNSPAKQEVARELISVGLTSGKAVISYQVVQEFMNVSTRKFQQPLSYADAEKYFDQVLDPLYEIPSSSDLIRKALEVAERWKYGFYDALIISGALMGNCSILYTEDLQDQQQIEFLKIVNPFR